MAIFVFVLALALAIAGGGGLYMSVDLLPTEIGVLYASCGVIAVSASCIVAALGALILKINGVRKQLARLNQALEFPGAPPAATAPQPDEPPPRPGLAPEPPRLADAAAVAPETRKGNDPSPAKPSSQAPTPPEAKQASAPPAPSTLVGRYSAGGAHYMIYSDGKIEAQTEDGQFTFASMSDFKAYMARRAKSG